MNQKRRALEFKNNVESTLIDSYKERIFVPSNVQQTESFFQLMNVLKVFNNSDLINCWKYTWRILQQCTIANKRTKNSKSHNEVYSLNFLSYLARTLLLYPAVRIVHLYLIHSQLFSRPKLYNLSALPWIWCVWCVRCCRKETISAPWGYFTQIFMHHHRPPPPLPHSFNNQNSDGNLYYMKSHEGIR